MWFRKYNKFSKLFDYCSWCKHSCSYPMYIVLHNISSPCYAVYSIIVNYAMLIFTCNKPLISILRDSLLYGVRSTIIMCDSANLSLTCNFWTRSMDSMFRSLAMCEDREDWNKSTADEFTEFVKKHQHPLCKAKYRYHQKWIWQETLHIIGRAQSD